MHQLQPFRHDSTRYWKDEKSGGEEQFQKTRLKKWVGLYTWYSHMTCTPHLSFFRFFCWLTSWFSVLFIVSLIIKVKLTFNLLLFICFSFQIESVKLFYFSPFFMLTLSRYLLSVICTLLFAFVHLFIICLVNKGKSPISLKYANWI